MMFGTRETFTYFQCAKCGCLQIAEIPDDLSRYYPPQYYSFNLSPERLFSNPLKNLLTRPRNRYAVLDKGTLGRLIYMILPNPDLRQLSHVGLREDSRVLEVGCGTGTLLYTLRTLGMTHLLGVDEYLENDIEYPNGLKILRKSIDDVGGTWDLVMFHHTLEHMPEQAETLAAAAKRLSEDGMCLLRMPTVSSYAWEHYGVNWVQLDAPRHLYLHSVESLTRLATKVGFRLQKLLYDSTDFQFWGSEQYVRDIPLRSERSYLENPERSIFSPEETRTFRRRADDLNRQGRGDQAAFYLRKTSTKCEAGSTKSK